MRLTIPRGSSTLGFEDRDQECLKNVDYRAVRRDEPLQDPFIAVWTFAPADWLPTTRVTDSEWGVPDHRFAAWPKSLDGRRACRPRAHRMCRSALLVGWRWPWFWRVVLRPSGCGRRQPRHRLPSAALCALRPAQGAPPCLLLLHAPRHLCSGQIPADADRARRGPRFGRLRIVATTRQRDVQ